VQRNRLRREGIVMKIGTLTIGLIGLISKVAFAQTTFEVTGTAIPQALLQQNYGKLPNGIAGYDLNICNISGSRQSVVSSEIYQALAQSTSGLQPIGRQILLSAIVRGQNRTVSAILNAALASATGVLSILGSANHGVPAGAVATATLSSMSVQNVLNHFSPALSNDQVEKFESDVLEPALVLDSGSCVERTVFALNTTPKSQKSKVQALSFHVR